MSDYIEKRDDAYFVADSRISLDSVVGCFLEGLAPETIVAECFPTLTLEQVYGSITFYLAHRSEIDAYLSSSESDEQAFRADIRARFPRAHDHLDALLASTGTRESR